MATLVTLIISRTQTHRMKMTSPVPIVNNQIQMKRALAKKAMIRRSQASTASPEAAAGKALSNQPLDHPFSEDLKHLSQPKVKTPRSQKSRSSRCHQIILGNRSQVPKVIKVPLRTVCHHQTKAAKRWLNLVKEIARPLLSIPKVAANSLAVNRASAPARSNSR